MKALTKEEELQLGLDIVKWQEIKNMTPKDEAEALEYKQYTRLGKKALERLVEQYLPMARKIAHQNHRKTGTKYELADLLQDAEFALVESALTYDPTKNCKLGTHAFYRISKKVSSTINIMRQVRLPENKMGEWNQINKAKGMPEAEDLEGEALLDFIVQETGLERSEIALIQQNMLPTVSLNAPIGESNSTLGEVLVGEEDPIESYCELPEVVIEAFKELSPEDQEIILFEYPIKQNKINYYDYLLAKNLTEKQFKTHLRRAIKRLQALL